MVILCFPIIYEWHQLLSPNFTVVFLFVVTVHEKCIAEKQQMTHHTAGMFMRRSELLLQQQLTFIDSSLIQRVEYLANIYFHTDTRTFTLLKIYPHISMYLRLFLTSFLRTFCSKVFQVFLLHIFTAIPASAVQMRLRTYFFIHKIYE